LRKSFTLPKPIPWRDSKISFIRFTDRKGAVHFFSEHFEVSPGLVHEYVRAAIFTKAKLLKLFH
jgi:hypothetical protein